MSALSNVFQWMFFEQKDTGQPIGLKHVYPKGPQINKARQPHFQSKQPSAQAGIKDML